MTKIGLAIFISVLLWSAVNPKDYLTWILEVAPALFGFGLLIATRHSFPLTRLLYGLILIHSVILMVGGHYTYAEEPLFNWLKQAWGWPRNNFDKLGHFAQGFVPALIAREIFIRKRVVSGRNWLNFLVVCVCLAVSAVYELVEWLAALLSAQASAAFLGTQGYAWDTQSDMAFALFGAISALLLLGRWHDRQISRLKES